MPPEYLDVMSPVIWDRAVVDRANNAMQYYMAMDIETQNKIFKGFDGTMSCTIVPPKMDISYRIESVR